MYTIEEIKATFPDLKCHEDVVVLPTMKQTEYEALKYDILKKGMLLPIWVSNGSIVDGRSRYKVLQELNSKGQLTFEPNIQEWKGNQEEVRSAIESFNLQRYHYTKQQLAVYAVKHLLPELQKEAQNRMHKVEPTEKIPEVQSDLQRKMQKGTAAQIAAMRVGTNEKYVQEVFKIQEKNKALLEYIMSKQMKIKEASDFFKLKPEDREVIFEQLKLGLSYTDAKAELMEKASNDNVIEVSDEIPVANMELEEVAQIQDTSSKHVPPKMVKPACSLRFSKRLPAEALERIRKIIEEFDIDDMEYEVAGQQDGIVEESLIMN